MSRHWFNILITVACFVSTETLAETIIENVGDWNFGFSAEKEEAGEVIYYSASVNSYDAPNVKLVFRCNALTGFARVFLVGMTVPKTKSEFLVTFAVDSQLPKQVLAYNENDTIQFGTKTGFNPPEEKSSILTAASMAENLKLTLVTGSASFQTSGGLDMIDKLVHSCNDFSLF